MAIRDLALRTREINNKTQFYVDFYYRGKRVRRVLGCNKEKALRVYAKIDTELFEEKFDFNVKKKDDVKFQDLAKQYFENYSKPHKRSWKRDEVIIAHLNAAFGNKRVYELNTKLLGKYTADRIDSGIKERTIDLEIACMKGILNKAVEWGDISSNPIKTHKMFNKDNSRIRYLKPEQLKQLYSECCEHLLPVVKMAVNTGCRKGEILNLSWKNVDFEKNIIYITNTKTDKNRFVPMSRELKEVLLNVRSKSKNKEFVFCDNKGRRLGAIQTAWRAATRRASIVDFRFHDLRHHFACIMASEGLDIVSLKEFLGHSTIEMTMRYASFMPDKTKKAVEILDAQSVRIWTLSKNDKEDKLGVEKQEIVAKKQF